MNLPKQLQCNLTNIINMGYIQTYTSLLWTVELTTRLKQDREKWLLTYVYVCIYYISGGKWSTTHSAQISQKQNRCDIYVIMKTKCTPSYYYNGFVANHALGHIINNVVTVHHVPRCMICHMAIVVTETGGHIVSMNVYIYVNIYVNI